MIDEPTMALFILFFVIARGVWYVVIDIPIEKEAKALRTKLLYRMYHS